MIRLILKILAQFIIVLLVVSFISFLLIYLSPGDAAESILSAQGIPFSKELLELKREEFGLNVSFFEQYFHWLEKIIHFDFGVSYNSGESVWEQLLFYFPNTLYLSFYVLLTTVGISLPISLVLAYHEGSKFDYRFISFLAFLNAIPSFVLGIVLIIVFSVQLHILPIQATSSNLGLVLPVLTLSLTMSTRYIPQLRTAFKEELSSSVVEGARGRGISEGYILINDVLYNARPFLLTLISLSLGSLLGGVAIIENLFSWPGVGKLLISIVSKRDYPLIQGVVLFVTVGVLIVNSIFQILIIWINPRTRLAQNVEQIP